MPVRSVRRRYLWVHIETDAELDRETLDNAIDAEIHFLYGVKGAVDINYRLIDYNSEPHDAIIRCNHIKLNDMRAALAHLSELGGGPARLDVRLVSGTIKTLKKKMSQV